MEPLEEADEDAPARSPGSPLGGGNVQDATPSTSRVATEERPLDSGAAPSHVHSASRASPAHNPPHVQQGAKENAPWIIIANIGQDVMKAILNLLERKNCPGVILSANGVVSQATITTQTHGTLYHRGDYEIVMLQGLCDPVNGSKVKITLGKEDAQIFGGMLTGSLIAATPVQVVILGQVPYERLARGGECDRPAGPEETNAS